MLRLLYPLLKIFWLIRRPVVLGARVLAFRNGEVLLVRMTYLRDWYLPGGGVERGESMREAALRELREECAMEPGDANAARLFGLYFTTKNRRSDHVALYVVEDLREIPGAKPDREIAEIKFFPVDQLPEQTSPATRRRIEEYLNGGASTDSW